MEYRFLAGTPIIDTSRKTWERYLPAVAIIVVSVAIFTLYFSTLAPTITWRNGGADSGELASAVAELGIAHPPGYPAYVLMGHLWSMLPLGADIAYRLNLFSAVSAIVAGLITMRLILDFMPTMAGKFDQTIGAIFGGGVLMLSPLLWSQATITEVYAPGLMMVSLATFIFLRKVQLSYLDIGLGGVFLGFGMGVLPQIVLMLPGVLLLLSFTQWQKTKSLAPLQIITRQWVILIAGFIIGTSVFLFLPLRTIAHPSANWGNPDTIPRFWAMVTAQQYRHLWLLPTYSEWLLRLRQGLALIAHQLGWVSILFAIWGGYRLWYTARAATVFLLTLLISTLLFRTSYPVEGNTVYLLPVLFVLALFAGLGLLDGFILARQHLSPSIVRLIGALIFVSVVWRSVTIFPLVDVSSDWQADSFGQQIMAKLPPDAVVVTDRDETTFSLWYLQSQGQRPDILVIDERLLFYDWYVQNLIVNRPSLQPSMLQPNQVSIPMRQVFDLSTPVELSADTFTYSLEQQN